MSLPKFNIEEAKATLEVIDLENNDFLQGVAEDNFTDINRQKNPFPIHVLPKKVTEYILEAEKTGLDKDLLCNIAFNVLTHLSGSKTVKVLNTWREIICLYNITVGDASVMKTTCKNVIAFPLLDKQKEDAVLFSIEMADYLSLDKKEQEKEDKPILVSSVKNDYSVEQLISGAKHQTAPYWIYKDEIASFYDRTKKGFNEKLQERTLSLWSGELINNETVETNRGVEVMTSHIRHSMCGATQTDKIDLLFHEDNISNGFCTRVLLHHVEPKPFVRQGRYEVSNEVKESYSRYINRLIEDRNNQSEIGFDNSAGDLFHEIKEDLREQAHFEQNKAIKKYLGKQAGTMARMCGVFAHLRDSPFVNVKDVEKAYELSCYYAIEYKKLLNISVKGSFYLPPALEKYRSYLKSVNNKTFDTNKAFQDHFIKEGAGKKTTFYSFKKEMDKRDYLKNIKKTITIVLI